MAKTTTKIKVDREKLDKIIDAMRALTAQTVRVGVNGEPGSDVVNAAMFNEFGTATIPERSFLRSTFNAKQSDYIKAMQKAVDFVVIGKISAPQALGQLGLRMVSDVQATIDKIQAPPLAQSTIDAKGSSKPLIDTGRLRASIGFDIVDADKVEND